MKLTRLIAQSLLVIGFASALVAAEPQSVWAHLDATGKLAYQSLPTGDRIMDFSHAGYMGGGVKLPMVAVKKSVRPTGADDTAVIQAAIDEVAKLAPVGGFRGAVLLDAGKFNCSQTLKIHASGVVLRGKGADKTIIAMTGAPHLCLAIDGAGSVKAARKTTKITDSYVPSGTAVFNVESAAHLSVGNTIIITRPVTPEWVKFMGMDALVRPGKTEKWVTGEIQTERVIKGISGSKITLAIPLSDSLDATYLQAGGATVSKAEVSGGISQVGIESLHILSRPQAMEITDDHNSGLVIESVTDAWVRDVTIENAIYSIRIESSARRMTLEGVQMAHHVATKGHAKPADFWVEGSQILINRCTGHGDDIFYFATGSKATGPNVILNSVFRGNGSIQPHMRWATGLLVDNCQVPGGGIDLRNRGTMGSGHGWTMGWGVVWNCSAKTLLIQRPPGAVNWAIGCRGARQTEPMPDASNNSMGPTLPEGIIDSHGKPVAPASLYLAQLRERLGPQAVKNIGY